jgi:hypothetical protein
MRTRFALALLLMGAAACAWVPVEVESDVGERGANLKTWAWLQRPPVARGEAEFGAVDARVRPAVERELGARRLRKVDRERPDFLVTYYAAIEKPIDAKAITYAAGVPLMTKPVTSYERGSFLVDVLDARTGKLLWRGVGRRVFDPKQTPEQRNERIDAAVASVIDEFAPL